MKVHHLNCGSMCPHGRKFINGNGGMLEKAEICCHCLLLETEQGLILVDTGLGTRDLDKHNSRVPWLSRMLMGVQMDLGHSALHQVRNLGFNETDVTHILLTHLDYDHAGGISDFPNATVHVLHDEHERALNPHSFNEKQRYIKSQWAHKPNWQLHQLQGDRWQGFEGVRTISAKETNILLVPTIGHTSGHCAVAVQQGEQWLLHCGDAYFHHGEMQADPYCPPGLSLLQNGLAYSRKLMEHNKEKLRQLKGQCSDRIQLFSAHDVVELKTMQAKQQADLSTRQSQGSAALSP